MDDECRMVWSEGAEGEADMKTTYIFMLGMAGSTWPSIFNAMNIDGASPQKSSKRTLIMRLVHGRLSLRSCSSGNDGDSISHTYQRDSQLNDDSPSLSMGSSSSHSSSSSHGSSFSHSSSAFDMVHNDDEARPEGKIKSLAKSARSALRSSSSSISFRRGAQSAHSSNNPVSSLHSLQSVSSNGSLGMSDWELIGKASDEEPIDEAKRSLIDVLCKSDIFKHEDGDFSSFHRIIGESEDVYTILELAESMREFVWSHIWRTEPNFVAAYEDGLRGNFSAVAHFDPKGMYGRLGYSDEKGIEMSSAALNEDINGRIEKETDAEARWFLRQCGHVLRNDATKKAYDLYIQGHIETLQCDEQQAFALHDAFSKIINAKAKLDESRNVSKKNFNSAVDNNE